MRIPCCSELQLLTLFFVILQPCNSVTNSANRKNEIVEVLGLMHLTWYHLRVHVYPTLCTW